METFDFFTFGASVFIDEVSHTLQTGQLETIGVSEGQAAHCSGSVISCFSSFDLVVEKYDLGTGSSEDLVDCSDLTKYTVCVFHGDVVILLLLM